MQTIAIEQDKETLAQIIQIQTTLLEIKEEIKSLKSEFYTKSIKENKYFSMKEICEYLGVSATSIYDWIKTRDFPQGKLIGKNRRFHGSEVQKWAEHNNVRFNK